MNQTPYIVVLITAKDMKEANKIAKGLIEKKLVACVNMIEKIKSIFWWEKKIDQCRETLLICKTKKVQLNKIIKCVKSLHSYTVPEVIAMPIIGGNVDYLNWVNQSVKGK